MRKVFRDLGVDEGQIEPVVSALRKDPERRVDFMMRFELGLEAPDPRRARRSAATIALPYVIGGLVPLASYILLPNLLTAFWVSAGVTAMVLFIFGYVKGHFTGITPLRGGIQTVFTGGLAAAAAFGIAKLIS